MQKDSLSAIFFIILGGIAYWMSLSFSSKIARWPQVLILILLGLSVLLFSKGLRSDDKQSLKQLKETVFSIFRNRTFWSMVFEMLYLVSINIIGYVISTAVYILFHMWFLGIKRLRLVLFSALIFGLFVFVVFKMILNLPLPSGIFF